jgi:DNA-binding MarR family transcriptional regulator
MDSRSPQVLTRRPLTDDLKRAAWALSEVHRAFCEEAGRHDMPLQYVTSFLLVAMDEGRGVNEYAERAGVSKSVMSRHLLDIGPRMRNQSTGFGLVEQRPNMHELRRHEVFLTPKAARWSSASCGFGRAPLTLLQSPRT